MCCVKMSEQQQRLPYTALTDWFCIPKVGSYYNVHTLSHYVKEKLFVFKGLTVYQSSSAAAIYYEP